MRNIYKADIHEIIKEEVNLDPNRFKITEKINNKDKQLNTILSTIDGKMHFTFLNPEHTWDRFKIAYSLYSPGFPERSWYPEGPRHISFDEAKVKLIDWLKIYVIPYFEDQDLGDVWNDFQFETNIFQLTQIKFGDNSTFSLDESVKIINAIDNLKQLIIDKFEATDSQISFLNERFTYLSGAVNRVGIGKFDWTNLMIQVLIAIAINMGIDKETGRQFIELVNEAFKNIQHLLGQ